MERIVIIGNSGSGMTHLGRILRKHFELSFVMPCLVLAKPGEAPENWELSLPPVPAPPNAVIPVIEISTPVEATPTLLPPPQTNTCLVTDGVSLALDRAVQMDDGYLIYATTHDENSGLGSIDIPLDAATFHLLDARMLL